MSSGADLLMGAAGGRAPRGVALRRAAEHGLFGLVPLVTTIALIAYQFKLHAVALDFHVAYWPAAQRLLHGLSPYAAGHRQITGGTAFVYPALSAVLLAPFGLVSRGISEFVYMLLCLACIPATLRVLRVRDWRVYGIGMLWFPLFDGWQSGNVTLPLMLMVALTWRHRDRSAVAGLLTAAAIGVKPFVWPLALWLLATRRWSAAAYALAWGLLINLLAWAIVGYGEIHAYLHLSSAITDALWRGGYSMIAVAHHLGLGRPVGTALLAVCSAFAAAALLYVGLVRRRERDALTLAVVLMLLASPLLWAHYFSLLLVPLALSRPRLTMIWVLPVLMWPIPPRQPVFGWEEGLAWGITATCVVVALRSRDRRAEADGRDDALAIARGA